MAARENGLGTTWPLVTVEAPGGTTFCAASSEDGLWAVPALRDYAGLFEALQDWDELASELRAYEPGKASPISDGRVLAPIRYPRTVLCSGSNYRDHLEEMSGDGSARVTPFFFCPD